MTQAATKPPSNPNMHVIRLRAAWRTEQGRAVRRFNRPTGLEDGTRVWLAWDGQGGHAQLNGEPLDPDCSRHEVTGRLQKSNELLFDSPAERLLATVRLELGP